MDGRGGGRAGSATPRDIPVIFEGCAETAAQAEKPSHPDALLDQLSDYSDDLAHAGDQAETVEAGLVGDAAQDGTQSAPGTSEEPLNFWYFR
jgi:hypothetical protein